MLYVGVEDWREHVDQMQQYSAAINSCMRETRGLLGRLADDIGRTLDKIASRERYVNHELTHQLAALRAAHNRRADRRETYRQASGGLADKSKHLAEVGLCAAFQSKSGHLFTDAARVVCSKRLCNGLVSVRPSVPSTDSGRDMLLFIYSCRCQIDADLF